jgi:SulP family sulfate permease
MGVVKMFFPFLAWGPLINGKNLKADFVAGLTVSLVLIPQSMAYAQLAGLPPIYGLYAALLPGLVGAMWGSSFHLATGPVAMTSLLTMATLIPFGNGDPNFVGSEKYIELAVLLAFMVGSVRLLIGIFKLTVMANFLSQPVIRGFINAGALIIGSSQVSKVFGVHMHRSDFYLQDIVDVFMAIPKELHMPTLIIGMCAMAIIAFLKKFFPKVPAALTVVVLGSVLVKFMGWFDPSVVDPNFHGAVAEGKHYVAVVGFIPAGLPKFGAPNFDLATMIAMIPGAFVVMFIGFMEFNSVNKAIAPKSGQKIDVRQEMLGQGVSALVGSFSSCYPTSGSFSRTALNFAAGGKTGMSSVITAGFVTVTLLFLTQYLVYLPQAVLAAIIIMAVAGLIDFKAMFVAWKIDKFDGIASVTTFLASIIFAPHIVNGILIGGALALALHLYSTMQPKVETVSNLDIKCVESGDHVREIHFPAMSFDGQLYFANAEYFELHVREIFENAPEAKKVIVLGGGINEMDASGAAMLKELLTQLHQEGRGLVFTNLKPQILEVLKRADLMELIGHEIFKSEDAARFRLQLLHKTSEKPVAA